MLLRNNTYLALAPTAVCRIITGLMAEVTRLRRRGEATHGQTEGGRTPIEAERGEGKGKGEEEGEAGEATAGSPSNPFDVLEAKNRSVDTATPTSPADAKTHNPFDDLAGSSTTDVTPKPRRRKSTTYTPSPW